MFLERKILKAMKGLPYYYLDCIIGRQSLSDSVAHFGHDHPYTALDIQLKDIDPDDAFSTVPYERGFAFLYFLEQTVGGDQAMNPFLRAYCQHFAYGTVTSQTFKAFFLRYFEGKVEKGKLDSIDWDTWLHSPGMPPDPQYDRALVDEAEALARRWVADPKAMQAEAEHPDIRKWDSDQVTPARTPDRHDNECLQSAVVRPLTLSSFCRLCTDGVAAADGEERVQGQVAVACRPRAGADGSRRPLPLH